MISLICSACEVRFDTIFKATDHFLKTHKSHLIDFEVVTMVKRTTAEGVVSCYTPNEKKKLRLRRNLNCGICRCQLDSKSSLIDHFNRDHPGKGIAVRLGKISFLV